MERTKEEKKAYFKALRANWKNAKSLMDQQKISDIEAIIATHGMNISATGFFFVSLQMKAQGLDGLPYLDAKTYKGWRDNGFQVKKGEKSTLSGITWIGADKEKVKSSSGDTIDGKASFCFPKEYHLFHRSQVEAIGVNATPIFAECA